MIDRPSPPIITLTTDFGSDSPYVAQMKGVILGIASPVTIIDVTHAIPPQSVFHGALTIEQATVHFPAGTIHIGVIDPGVGTDRPLLLAEIGSWYFIGPDNGLWTLIERRFEVVRVVELCESRYWNREVSRTFHGRDIMAPVAAHLAGGIAFEAFGRPSAIGPRIDWPEPRRFRRAVEGVAVIADSFGNLITNISRHDLPADCSDPARLQVEVSGVEPIRLVRTYGEGSAGELVALVGSSGKLEIAQVNGSALEFLAGSAMENRSRVSRFGLGTTMPSVRVVCKNS